MKIKKLITISLLAFVTVSIGYVVISNTSNRTTAESMTSNIDTEESLENTSPEEDSSITPDAENKTIVQYFHGNSRCVTCRTIEALTREALETEFSQELRSGKLEFIAINLDEPSNWHFVDDYQLATRTVVIANLKNGKQADWKRLDEVWNLVRDRDSFLNYVKTETKSLMGQNS